MESNIFIPKKIKVGYQKRSDTYSKKLAYVVYYDEKGVLRKAKSWEDWRDKKISPDEFDNEPMSGFVLNKKAGGERYSWNPRQTYVRVYDPRGFEIEITVPNLLYILENTNSIKGKGLEGEFVYGWSGKELILVPTSSPDYEDLVELTNTINSGSYIETKDLVVGYTYLTRQNQEYIYMGEFETYNSYKISIGKRHIFSYKSYNSYYFDTFKTIKEKIIKVVDSSVAGNYDTLLTKLNNQSYFSGDVDGIITPKKKDIWEYYNITNLKKELKDANEITQRYNREVDRYRSYYGKKKFDITIKKNDDGTISFSEGLLSKTMNINDFIKEYQPIRKRQ